MYKIKLTKKKPPVQLQMYMGTHRQEKQIHTIYAFSPQA